VNLPIRVLRCNVAIGALLSRSERQAASGTCDRSGHERIMRKDRLDAGVDGPLKAFSYSTLAPAFESARAFDVLERALRWYRGRTLQCHFKVRSVH
jgi:hypothetical protein